MSATAPALEQGTVLAKSRDENFPVALRLLPAASREHLMAIYGYARFVDDVGDLVGGDRRAQLDWVEEELDRAFAGEATHPVFVRLGKSVLALQLDRQPFLDLLAANRQDQEVATYPTWDSLADYCRLSANPVGRLVLAVFGCADEVATALSDEVCTGLQLVEHLQDIAEDHEAGRVYLPGEDLARFGVIDGELAEASATPALRRLVAFEVGRARGLLLSGLPLIERCPGSARLALAGFVGGGLAQLEAIERVGYDVLGHAAKASKAAVLRHAARALAGKPRREGLQ
ncbi:MAG: hpnC [Acidimicrobiaceae bacterium]|nr:hpnC [Acidimicrobiaceae bacterium]